jgi:hypothetical protein
MTSDPLDRALSTDEIIVPSSGFAAAVMDRVSRDAAALPPIPFPWRRLLLVASSTAVVAAVVTGAVTSTIRVPDSVAIHVDETIRTTAALAALQVREASHNAVALFTAGALVASLAASAIGLRVAWPKVR